MEEILKKSLTITLAAFFAQAAQASEPFANFDQGFDNQAAMENFYTGVAENDPSFVFVNNSLKATTDCAVFVFKAGDPALSGPEVLRSQVYQTVCEQVNGEEKCHDEFLREVTRNVSVSLRGGTGLKPWEKEVFRVCLKDTRITSEAVETSHQYELSENPGPENDYLLTATAVKKVKSVASGSGIKMVLIDLPEAGKGLRFTAKFLSACRNFFDYAGELLFA